MLLHQLKRSLMLALEINNKERVKYGKALEALKQSPQFLEIESQLDNDSTLSR